MTTRYILTADFDTVMINHGSNFENVFVSLQSALDTMDNIGAMVKSLGHGTFQVLSSLPLQLIVDRMYELDIPVESVMPTVDDFYNTY